MVLFVRLKNRSMLEFRADANETSLTGIGDRDGAAGSPPAKDFRQRYMGGKLYYEDNYGIKKSQINLV